MVPRRRGAADSGREGRTRLIRQIPRSSPSSDPRTPVETVTNVCHARISGWVSHRGPSVLAPCRRSLTFLPLSPLRGGPLGPRSLLGGIPASRRSLTFFPLSPLRGG